MQESFPPEHSGELLADTLEQLLDGGAVADESGAHLSNKQNLGQHWNVSQTCTCVCVSLSVCLYECVYICIHGPRKFLSYRVDHSNMADLLEKNITG